MIVGAYWGGYKDRINGRIFYYIAYFLGKNNFGARTLDFPEDRKIAIVATVLEVCILINNLNNLLPPIACAYDSRCYFTPHSALLTLLYFKVFAILGLIASSYIKDGKKG